MPFNTPFEFTRYYHQIKGMIVKNPYHSHPQFELLYFDYAYCDYILGGEVIQIEPGDLLVMNGLARHWPINATIDMYIRTCIVFEPRLIQELYAPLVTVDPLLPFHQLRNVRIRLRGEHKLEYEHLLGKLNKLLQYRDPVNVNRQMLVFLDLLLFVCDRCRASAIISQKPITEREQHVLNIINYIEAHFNEDITLELLETNCHMSKFHLARVFQEITGVTVFDYINNRRINQAKVLFHFNKQYSVTDVCYHVGFNHLAHFSRVFKKIVGKSPVQYRKELIGS
ncbi:MAG: AraC family transcriptional regulator [Paenibacillus sp.]|jgi:AraC-like DNA-binding protein|nr:AraC family transcriptional regulator [Paenibacillus sp.]